MDKALQADYTSQAVGMDTPGFASPIRAFPKQFISHEEIQ